MGPEFWKPDKSTKLKKCSERRTDSCDLTETDGCCGVIPCSYCLEWVPYGDITQYGVAEFDGTAWTGIIADVTFVAFWERGYTPAVEYSTSFESTAGTEAGRLADAGTELNATITTDGNPSIDTWSPRTGSKNLRLFIPTTQWVQFDFTATGVASFSFWYKMSLGPNISIDVDGVISTVGAVGSYTQVTITGLAAGAHSIRITRPVAAGNALDIDDVSITMEGSPGECEFVVELDGIEVYRNDCYGGQSCRDSSDTVETAIGYDSGLLTWTKIEKRPLEYIPDPDAPGCKTWLCGNCECTCECLCVAVIDYTGDTLARGEICDVAYPCDAPIWEGTVGDYLISIALGRDEYGECVVTPTINGTEYDAIAIGGCESVYGTIVLDDGTTISFTCKVCDCTPDNTTCCPDRVVWPTQLTIEMSDPSGEGCYDLTGVLTEISPDSHTYGGTLTGSCTYCGHTYDIHFGAVLSCAVGGWIIDFEEDSPPDGCGAVPPDTALTQISCDPILLIGDVECFVCTLINCDIPDPPNPPMPYPHPPFCVSVVISENP